MIIEILASKADDEMIVVFGVVCAVIAAVLKYKRLQKIGTVFNPKDPNKDNKKDKA